MLVEQAPRESIVKSGQQTRALAGRLADIIRPGDILLLTGPLGSGKTTFVQGLAGALGIEDRVKSPSYALIADYDVSGRGGIQKMVHIDLYRLGKEQAPKEPAVREALSEAREEDRVTAVEWADRLEGGEVEGRTWRVSFSYGADINEREIKIESP